MRPMTARHRTAPAPLPAPPSHDADPSNRTPATAMRRVHGTTRWRALPIRLLWLLLWLLLTPLAVAAPRIGVATMQPGEIFFERFGHNAIIVDDPALAEPVAYNFGYFDMAEDGFVDRFVHGRMRYLLARLPWREDLSYYRMSGRGVSIQWLRLDDATAIRLADALAENARPENAHYRYDYFTDNCATRVRDALDRALGGALERQLRVRSQGNTYRSEAVRLASPAPWMWLGFDLVLGPAADQPMSRWDEAYVPMRLADSLREVRLADGQPLVASEEVVVEHRIAPEPDEFAQTWWLWLLSGLAIAVVGTWLSRRAPRTAAAVSLLFWLIGGVLGTVMLFVWLDTEHRFGWANQNLLLFSPLGLVLLPGAWRLMRGRAPGRVFVATLWAVLALAVIAVFAHWVMQLPQANAHWIAALLPIHAALLRRWRTTPDGDSTAA